MLVFLFLRPGFAEAENTYLLPFWISLLKIPLGFPGARNFNFIPAKIWELVGSSLEINFQSDVLLVSSDLFLLEI